MAVTARPKAATAIASSHGAPSPSTGLELRLMSACPEGGLDLVVGTTSADDVAPPDPLTAPVEGLLLGAGELGG